MLVTLHRSAQCFRGKRKCLFPRGLKNLPTRLFIFLKRWSPHSVARLISVSLLPQPSENIYKACPPHPSPIIFCDEHFLMTFSVFPMVTGLCNLLYVSMSQNLLHINKSFHYRYVWLFSHIWNWALTHLLTVGSVQREHLEHSWQGAPGERGCWQKWS